MDTPQTHNQSIVAKWQVSSTVAKKRKPNSRISLNTPDDSPRALSPAPTPGEQPVAGPSTPPLAPTVPENQPAPRTKKVKTTAVNVEQLAAKYAPPTRKLNELGGLDEQIDQLLEVVGLPLRRPEMYFQMGTERPKGVLLHGVQGGGKTQLVNCLAGVSCVPLVKRGKLMVDVSTSIYQSLGTFNRFWDVWRIGKNLEGYI
jgi:ribosome biogenesis ATPase